MASIMPSELTILFKLVEPFDSKRLQTEIHNLNHARIPWLKSAFSGSYSSQENLNREYNYAVTFQFEDAAAQQAFSTHPEWQKIFNEQIKPYLQTSKDAVTFFSHSYHQQATQSSASLTEAEIVFHIVLLQLKGKSREELEPISLRILRELASIEGISSLSGGINTTENQIANFGFKMIFASPSHRDAYLTNPQHRKIAEEVIIPSLEDGLNSIVSAFDYTQRPSP
jgi:hypothetical protein